MNKYTVHGDEVDEIIDVYLRDIVNDLRKNLPEVASIFLTGGFGRGEGSVKLKCDADKVNVTPLKDFDFILIFKDKIPFDRVDKTRDLIDKKLNNESNKSYHYTSFTVDLNSTTLERCNRFPDIVTYELKVASHLMYGLDIRSKIKIRKEEVPLRSGARILFQKGISLIGQFSTNDNRDLKLCGVQKEMFIYESAKVFVELGTALSILSGEYVPSYKERGILFSEKYEEMFPDLCVILPDLGQKIHYYTKFKLNPKFNTIDDPMGLWFDAKEYLLKVTKYYMTQYLQMGEYDNYNIFCNHMRKHLKTMYYKPLINNTIKTKLKIEPPTVCLSILNYMFQLKGSLRHMENIMTGGDYNHQCKIINHFSCPTLDFFYCTLVLLNSINHEGDMDIRCANVVKETIRLSEKSTDKLSDTWDDTRIIYLASLYYLPYMY